MSGVKVDIQWSPSDDDMFITHGTAINLYQVKNRDTFHEQHDREHKSAERSKIIHLATHADLQFVKSIAWCPRPESKNVLAVAQANGRISIIGFETHGNDDLIGKEFNIRFNRQCNYLSWNPVETHLLAEGFERNRNEPCVLIWDVNNNANIEVERPSRHSFSEGPFTKPYLELGHGEASSSFSWFPNDGKTFIMGVANKHLRVYDLRDSSKCRLEAHHRCVSGICVEPLEDSRLASFSESQVAVWDLRIFDRPINTITESKNIMKLSWCPKKLGVLSILTKDNSSIKLHDIRHSLFGSDEIEQASIERNIQPFGKSQLSSFCWHPRQENRLITVLANGQLRDMVVFERIPMEWSSSFKLMMPLNGETIRCLEETEQDNDISLVMKRRVTLNYGLQAQDIAANIKAIENEPHLMGLWRWIYNVREVISSQTASNSKLRIPAATGILSLLRFDREDDHLVSEAVPVHWKASEGGKYSKRTHYRCAERTMALQLCGWIPDQQKQNFESFIHSLVEQGDPERASAISLFYLHIKQALEILSNCAMSAEEGRGKPSLQAVAMALSGYTEDKNALWRRTCGTLLHQLENPYLRAVFAFLACDEDDYENVLNEVDMSVEDRVGFALNYLPDAKLKSYLCKLCDELTQSGDLDGILLTGMTDAGINLLENFVDRTADVQTAAIAAVFSTSHVVMKDPRVMEWIDGYRDLLDRWRFWHQRAHFDIVRQSFVQEHRVPAQVLVSCNFCGKSISTSMSILNRARNMFNSVLTRGPQNRPKITCCPSCRKALPRCAICLFHMGTSSGTGIESGSGAKLTMFQEWFTWCQTCRHGGHAAHITEWFREHSECPVTGCPCKCVAQDAVSLCLPETGAGIPKA
ncbi:GATOR complex protein MIOS-A [Aplysia californica]|uniref:GATOR complex protein MIOS-A n=1 Tax=Aplysia californica TaxID=6500 RepID=A0ABM1A505_APLCA|nr:GATOR complex protein MIOS-A [Aplysia californica]